jgi:hypothetical protein
VTVGTISSIVLGLFFSLMALVDFKGDMLIVSVIVPVIGEEEKVGEVVRILLAASVTPFLFLEGFPAV